MTQSVLMFLLMVGAAMIIDGFIMRLVQYRYPNSAAGKALAVVH